MQMNDYITSYGDHKCTHARTVHKILFLVGCMYTTVIRSLGVAINLPYTHCTLDGSLFQSVSRISGVVYSKLKLSTREKQTL